MKYSKIKKMLMVLMLTVVVIFSGSLVQARPLGNWIQFTTIHGKNIGQSDVINVYYDADTLQIFDYVQSGMRSRTVICRLWQEGRLGSEGVTLVNNQFVGGWVYYSESNRYPLRTGGSSIRPMLIPKESVLHQLLKTLYSSDDQLKKGISELLEKNKKRDEEKREQARLKKGEEIRKRYDEMEQTQSQEEKEKKWAEENLKESIREGKKRRVDWKYVDVYSHHKNPGELYDPRSNMTEEEYGSWQRIRNTPGPCPYGWGEEECAKRNFFELHKDLEDGGRLK